MLTLDQCLKANRPLVFVVAENDLELLQYINENYKKHKYFVYSTTLAGTVPLAELLEKKFQAKVGRSVSTTEVLKQILGQTFPEHNNLFNTYIFLDCNSYINEDQNIRRTKDIVSRYSIDHDYAVNLIFVSNTVCVPSKLERLSEMVFFDLPPEEELRETAQFVSKKLKLEKKGKVPSEEAIANLRGLTRFEAEQAFLQSYAIHNEIRVDFIRDYKKNALAKTDLLSLLETNVTFDDIGGMTTLKKWVKKMAGGWTVEGRKFGLPLLKGLLLVGLPGCGKSLICKSIGNEWSLPVISFDPSRVFSSRVGTSEANIRRVLQIVENIAPCLGGSARVTLADGQKASIQELYFNKFRGNVISLDSSFQICESLVQFITKKTSDNLYNLRTTIGNMRSTGDHRFPVLKSNGELHWVRTDNIVRGDFIVCPRHVTANKSMKILDYFDDDTRIYSEVFCKDVLEKAKKEDFRYYVKHSRRISKSGIRSERYRGFVFKHEIERFNLEVSDLSHVRKVSRGGGGIRDSFLAKIPPELSTELFYALGLLWSDGNIGDRSYFFYDDPLKSEKNTDYRTRSVNHTRFYNNNMALHEELHKIFKKEFDITLRIYSVKGTNGKITGDFPLILAEFLRRLQKDLLSVPEDKVWAWLSGVLDGDGHIHKQRVNYSAVKLLNSEYLRDVFLRVGLPVTSPVDDFRGTSVEITSSKFIKKFCDNIVSKHRKKSENLCSLSGFFEYQASRMDTLDVREDLKKSLVNKGLLSSSDPITCKGRRRNQTIVKSNLCAEIKRTLHDYMDRNVYVDIEKVRKIFDGINCGDKWYLNGNFFFSRVKDVEPIHGVHDVYDLCLDKNHNFIANRMFTHNCVLFLDEAEKGLAGMHSSSFSDAGVTARVIGSFLVWMQECTKPVFTVATSNNIQYLPPELISRFDETFFVNMPNFVERVEILKIHIKKLGRDPANFHVEQIATQCQDLSGREIEQVLKEAMYDAFHSRAQDITTDSILSVLARKTSVLRTMAEQLKFVLDWVGWDDEKQDGIRARYANPTEKSDVDRVNSEIEALLKDIEKGSKNGS